MRFKNLGRLFTTALLLISQSAMAQALQSQQPKPQNDKTAATTAQNAGQDPDQSEGPHQGPSSAAETAKRFRRTLPVIPSLVRGSDALLSQNGQRAIQTQLVTSSNVKEPTVDAFPFAGGLPVEASELVQIPDEQFAMQPAKFNATVPVLDPISKQAWHFTLGVPFFSPAYEDGLQGIRSAAPLLRATGPVFGGKMSLFESFEYRLSKTTNQSVFGGLADSKYQSYDWNTHADVTAWQNHLLSGRLAVFSQNADLATLTALTEPGATPDYLMRGGQASLSDTYTWGAGLILDSIFNARYMRLHVVPQAAGTMVLVSQGDVMGNYFDSLHRTSHRLEWKEALRLPEFKGWGRHQVSFGGGLARAAFDSNHESGTIELRGSEGQAFSLTNFTGSGLESIGVTEADAWVEDRWAPSRRANFTFGLKYDWTTLSRQHEWAPRFAFALLPFNNDRTVIRGGMGVFYDILPMNAGTFPLSQQRVVQFFSETDQGDSSGEAEERTLLNTTTSPHLKTSHITGWNVEVDQQVTGTLFLRARAEDRRGVNLLLVNPNAPAPDLTSVIVSDHGTSRYREVEGTVNFRPTKSTDLNLTYVRSSAVGDLNTFTSVLGTFEKLFLSKNQYAHSRSDSTDRFLAWGDVRLPGDFTVTPALDVHTGFPFGFIDADNTIPGKADFGRYPQWVSLDLGFYRDFKLNAFDRASKLRLGFRVYNVTNHFNPRDVLVSEIETETQKTPLLDGFLNGPGRGYRASVSFSF
jgi:hypothetical protein